MKKYLVGLVVLVLVISIPFTVYGGYIKTDINHFSWLCMMEMAQELQQGTVQKEEVWLDAYNKGLVGGPGVSKIDIEYAIAVKDVTRLLQERIDVLKIETIPDDPVEVGKIVDQILTPIDPTNRAELAATGDLDTALATLILVSAIKAKIDLSRVPDREIISIKRELIEDTLKKKFHPSTGKL